MLTGSGMLLWFGLGRPRTVYGRMGVIFCDDRPAIDPDGPRADRVEEADQVPDHAVDLDTAAD